jgi:hypothetical protein
MTTCSTCKKEMPEAPSETNWITEAGSVFELFFTCADCNNNPYRRPNLDKLTKLIKQEKLK